MSAIEAKDLAASILTQLGQDFSIVIPDLTDPKYTIPTDLESGFVTPPARVSIDELTDGSVGGAGAFDKLMASNKAHLLEQFEKGRINGDQYAKAYVELTTAMLSSATQVILSADQSYWQAKLLQMQGRRAEIDSVTARVQLEIAKAELATANRQSELLNAQYVLTQMQIANADAGFKLTHTQIGQAEAQTNMIVAQRAGVEAETSISVYRLATMLPLEADQLTAQTSLVSTQKLSVEKDVSIADFRLINVLPKEVLQLEAQTQMVAAQISMIDAQRLGVITETSISVYRLSDILPKEAVQITAQTNMVNTQKIALDKEVQINDYKLDNMLPQELANITQQEQILFAQERLLQEQSESQRAQTLDFRTDGITPVTGSVGKQKALYTQQIDSYQKDAQQKVAKMYLDGWITQKTLDEGLTAPTQLTNQEINEVLVGIRQTHDMGS